LTPENFKQARLTLGFSQQQLADYLGIKSSRTIRRYESGDWRVSKVVIDKLKQPNKDKDNE